jgi:16S rRNA (adenine1518-N6/adenine1519-N6)-dimethyltransferase
VDAGSEDQFARVVGAAFSQRRKTLRNSLRKLLTPAQLEAAGVDAGVRAEQLNLSQFAALSRALSYDAQRAP